MITKIKCCDCGAEHSIEDLSYTTFVKCDCTGGYHEFYIVESMSNIPSTREVNNFKFERLKENIKDVQAIYHSNSDGPDSTECPMCNAEGMVEYSNGKRTRKDDMNDITHYEYCPFILVDEF